VWPHATAKIESPVESESFGGKVASPELVVDDPTPGLVAVLELD
jgi:hypothetical protein